MHDSIAWVLQPGIVFWANVEPVAIYSTGLRTPPFAALDAVDGVTWLWVGV